MSPPSSASAVVVFSDAGEKLAEAETFKEHFGLLPKKKRAASSSVGRREPKRVGRPRTNPQVQLEHNTPAMKQRMSKRMANKRVTVLKYKANTRVIKQLTDIGRTCVYPDKSDPVQWPRGLNLRSKVLFDGIQTRQQLKMYRKEYDGNSKSLWRLERSRKNEEDRFIRRLIESRNLRALRLKSRVEKQKKLSKLSERSVVTEPQVKLKKTRVPHFGVQVLKQTTNPALIKANKPLILSSDWEKVASNVDGVKNKIVSLFWTHLERKLLPASKPKFEDLNNPISLNSLNDQGGKIAVPSQNVFQKSTKPQNFIDSLQLAPNDTMQDQTVKVSTTRNRPPSCGLLKVSTLAKAVTETAALIRSTTFKLKKL